MSDDLIIQAESLELLIEADNNELVLGLACPLEPNDAVNVGGAEEVLRDVAGNTINLRTLLGAGGIRVQEVGDTIEFQNHKSDTVDPTVNDDSSGGFVVGHLWTNTVLGTSFILVDATPAAAQWDPFAGPVWRTDDFAPAAGQVTFILSQVPTDVNSLELDVNGVAYEGGGVDYSISGVTITWLNTEFAMSVGDSVVVQYR